MRKILPLSLLLLAASSFVSAQTYTVLHYFGSKPGDPINPGRHRTISQSRGGAMLTTVSSKALKISTSGSVQILHKFSASEGWPSGGLILARDGMYYGTTESFGTFTAGTVFKMSQDGSVTTLHDFTGGSDGENPRAAPIQSVEGDFYGTTAGSILINGAPHGSVYKIAEDGNLALLHAFTGSDGTHPHGSLVQGTDYYFYGTTNGPGNGTIFRISSTGDFKVLVNFNGTNGSHARSPLIQANDGNFYGVTRDGGTSGGGVLFRMTAGGALTVLHNFTGGSDGGEPVGPIVQASDGNLYGATEHGGKNGWGVLFRATLTGDVVPLHDFNFATGAVPVALFQHTNGILYGTTLDGGIGTGRGGLKAGVFYSLDVGLPLFVTYLPTYGRAGAVVQILGQGFTDSSEVFFNGTPGTIKAVYSTFMKAIVPDGATTGPITVTTATGTLTSNKVFIVHPN